MPSGDQEHSQKEKALEVCGLQSMAGQDGVNDLWYFNWTQATTPSADKGLEEVQKRIKALG